MHFFGGGRKGGRDGGLAFWIGALHRPAAVHGSLTEYPSVRSGAHTLAASTPVHPNDDSRHKASGICAVRAVTFLLHDPGENKSHRFAGRLIQLRVAVAEFGNAAALGVNMPVALKIGNNCFEEGLFVGITEFAFINLFDSIQRIDGIGAADRDLCDTFFQEGQSKFICRKLLAVMKIMFHGALLSEESVFSKKE